MAYLNGKRVVRGCLHCRLCAPAPKDHPEYTSKSVLCRSSNGIVRPIKSGCHDFEPKTLRDLPDVAVPEEHVYIVRYRETVEMMFRVSAPNRQAAIEQVEDGIAEGEQVAGISRDPVSKWSVVRCKEED